MEVEEKFIHPRINGEENLKEKENPVTNYSSGFRTEGFSFLFLLYKVQIVVITHVFKPG